MSQNFYFEPPSRIQLVDKMAHLLRYSEFLIVIAGPKGSGKTSVSKRLALVTQTSDISQILVTLEGETGAMSLALQCAKLVSDDYAEGMDPLTILHEKSRSLHDVGQHLLILIDNAEWLNDEAIELLAGLLVSGVGKPKVVLSGEESLVSRLHSLSLYELLEGRLHLETLQPFSEDEAKEFLALRFSSQQALSKRDLKGVYESSKGYPGRITSAASEIYRSGKITSRSRRFLPLPMPHMVGIGIVLLGVLMISAWQASQDSNLVIEPQIVAGRVSVPLDVSVKDPLLGDIRDDSITQMQSELSKLLAEQEKLLKQETALLKAPPAIKENTLNTPAVVESKPIPVTTILAKEKEGVSESSLVEKELRQSEKLIDKRPKPVAVKVLEPTVIASKPVNLPAVVSKPTAVVSKPTAVVSKPTAVVSKPTTVATPSIVSKPTTVATPSIVSKPAVVVAPSVVSKPDVITVKVAPKPKVVVSEKGTAVPKDVIPRSVVSEVVSSGKEKKSITATKASTSKWLKEEQLLTWPSTGYTLQVLGARSQSSVVQFMESLDSRDRLYYFTTMFKKAPWHVVVYGQYANRTAANRAVSSLPEELKKLKPWARSIKGVQQDIKKK
ncbi:AAA family ATPase [Neptunomonas japonica]|uniref:AAA family ATPase n=1 Tax=Neptunomonas japonica TaxID=417574 RepID=UPI00041A665B|nr:AAA family ATPase [Neptunomonas japonica]